MPTDFYDVLGAPADASSEELKRAYRGRVREYHPDVNDDPKGDEQFKLIRVANDVLSNPAERKDYDRLGHRAYVRKHLEEDDVPRFSVLPEFDESDDIPTVSGDSNGDRSSGTATPASSGSRGSSSSDSSTTGSTNQRSRRSQSSTRSGPQTQAGQSASSSETGGENRNRSNGSRSAGEQGSDSTQWQEFTDATSSKQSGSTVPSGVRRRRGLRRWYVVAVIAVLTYIGGLGSYLLESRQAAETLLTELTTAPVPALLGTYPIASPTAFTLSAVNSVTAGEPGISALFLVGIALLPLTVLTAVAQFGRGSAWMYALASLGPVLTLAAFPYVVLPTAAVLVGLVGLPFISGVGFLVDVGRFLLATR